MTRTEARQLTQGAVLDAARALFEERGFLATTVRDIAQQAGVSVGTVMGVGDKEALLVRLFDALIEERQRRIDTHDVHPRTPCSTAAVEVVEPFVMLFEEHRELAQVYASILVSGRHSSVVFTDLAHRLIAVFEQVVSACGCSDAIDARRRGEALHAAYIGTLFMWSASPDTSASDLTARLGDAFAAICTRGGGRL